MEKSVFIIFNFSMTSWKDLFFIIFKKYFHDQLDNGVDGLSIWLYSVPVVSGVVRWSFGGRSADRQRRQKKSIWSRRPRSSSFKGINRKRDNILRWVSLSDCAERFRNRSAKFRNRSAKSLSETQQNSTKNVDAFPITPLKGWKFLRWILPMLSIA